ncbi:pyruvate dehydrogenase E1 component beta subunit [Brevundimonas nasdae]|uniref:Pyruvate dehydrogenase E1 component subunit beta n=1 Tax=Brevundimonas nasdae TaxID=172043 RepID=A0ABX8TLM6_9CAUL|nr:pyruvate dehydrogenase complex E1 component subunit beta [Brevundimonas nasdae]MBK6024179.1 pyruvate dehydrogenase complex E1 component subunit beta [Brevundimonas nasdae]MDQ0450834.1 pyruvate dehydrogenase E1 component beta subunit [Brevundimonas nasdae]QYC11544.1 pyruvate dehydrogenase complex E1 component subunit beta [Brevundimonas nasdae]QYC14332.1 pyruvate dehydrogenase complex E1 component subunit beta [Brevundimonas nasdae]
MTDILMPALSPTMEEGTLTKWHIKAGDSVSAGQVIAEIETDKATMEVEAVDEGEVLEILVPEGSENVKVNTPIARLAGEDGAAAPAPKADVPAATAEGKTGDPEKAPQQTSTPKVELRDPEIPADAKLVKTTVRDALRDAMAEEMRRDDRVFLIGEEVAQYQGAYKVSRELLQEFGERRVVDTPITEHGFAGLGVGAAMSGLKPIVEFMTFNFAMQAIDHIINSAAKTLYMSGGQIRADIVFRGPNGAASRVGAQHSQDYSAWYAQVPGLKVIAPYDAADAKGLLKAAIRDPNPIVFLEHEMLYGTEFDVPEVDDYVLPIGKAKVRREGKDVTITAHARMVGFALQAAEKLAEEGIEAEVIDLRTLRPLDHETIVESVKKTNRLVSAEEGWGPMGVGAEVVARVIEHAFDYLDAPPLRVHQEDVPLPYAANLEALSLPGVDKIIAAVKQVVA